MTVFELYPGKGRKSLGIVRGSNSRHEYCSKLIQLTGQKCCAYCGIDLVETYDAWLSMVLDHVVPVSVCKVLNIPVELAWDYSNTVLACAACNGFCNRYRPSVASIDPTNLNDFYNLRDQIFLERKAKIQERRENEKQYYEKLFKGNA